MLSLLAPPRTSAIAFDAGSTGVRACQLVAGRGAVRVVDSLEIALTTPQDAGATAANEAQDPLEHALPRLSRLVGQAAFRGTEVALVLSPPQVRYQTMHVPDGLLAQPEPRILAAVAWEVSRERRCEPDELEVRYWRLPIGHQHNIMAVSLLRSHALTWFQTLSRSGLQLKRIDGAASALSRLGARQLAPEKRDLWAILDIGLRRSTLTLVIGDVPTYVRVIPIGSAEWTRALLHVFGTSEAGAEQIKRATGIRAADAGDDGGGMASIAFTSLRESLTELVRQVELCLGYVVHNYAETQPTALLLTGGGAGLIGLDEYLSLHLGVAVAPLASPFDAGRPRVFKPSPILAAAAALLDLEDA